MYVQYVFSKSKWLRFFGLLSMLINKHLYTSMTDINIKYQQIWRASREVSR